MVRQFYRWLGERVRKMFAPTPIRSISIAADTLQDISDMAGSAHPKEMLAFLSATKGNVAGDVLIDELQLQAYFASEDSASVMLSNLPMTTSIIGTVHSHPGGNRRPSRADRTLFSRFGYVHAIIGEPYRPRDIAFYDKYGSPIVVRIV